MKINEISFYPHMVIDGDPLRLRVGHPAIEGGHVVEKINFHPANREFNKGLEITGSSYAVYFEGIPERRIVLAGMVSQVEVVKEVKVNPESEVELPE
jgi:hypothetical protein